jgi:hypothetical protein
VKGEQKPNRLKANFFFTKPEHILFSFLFVSCQRKKSSETGVQYLQGFKAKKEEFIKL